MTELGLPDEVKAAIADVEVTQAQRLAALAVTLVGKRQEAVNGRKESGIEDVWLKAEEAYLGMDDANRGSFAKAKWAKPVNLTQGLQATGIGASAEGKSTAFVRLTSRYVDAGAAKLSEILLPADEKAFSFTNTPLPDLIRGLDDMTQAVHNGQPLFRDPKPGEVPPTPGAAAPPQGVAQSAPNAVTPPAAPGPLPNMGTGVPDQGIPVTVRDIAQEAVDAAQAAAKKAETRIHDWMVESRFRAEGRKIVFDAARLGVGVLKGPFPRKSVSRSLSKDKKVITHTRVKPAYEWKSPWDIYPDAACGENIQNGEYLFESDRYSRKQLRKLVGDKGFIKSAIEACLKAGPGATAETDQRPGEQLNKNRFKIWHYYGTITRDEMIAAGGMKAEEETGPDVFAICTMVDDTVIRAVMNPLDSGELPYHAVPWQRRAGHWAGVGIGEQIEMPQRAANASIRAMFNNAGMSAGSIIVIDKTSIVPADGAWALTPDKLFWTAPGATMDDVAKAFKAFQVPNMTPQLMSIFELSLRIAEEVTNIPLVTQGQSGTTTPETYGATQLQNNNANQLLRSIAYAYDDYLTEPVVNQSYEYLLLDPNVPEDEKGDWKIDAHGSVALVERAIQDQTIQQMSTMVLQPAFGVNPKKWFAEFSKTKRLNPKNFQYTEEEQKKIDSQPAPAAPAVEVAKIKSADAEKALAAEQALTQAQQQFEKMLADAANATKETIAGMRKEVDELRVKRDTDRDTIYVAAEDKRTQNEYAARMEELKLRERLAMLDYANKKDLKLDDVKAQLADTQMKLQVQKELSGVAHAVDLRKHDTPDVQEVVPPAAEPAGKAPDGKAFQA